jgi:DsbE subfamily thiol:disulfide oxidoreductase
MRPAYLPIVLFVALLGLFGWRLVLMQRGDMPNLIKTVMLDKPAPTFDLPPLDPGAAGLATKDLQGKVTLVNFFASWCVPCRAEHPLLRQLKGKVVLAGVAYKNAPADARGWLARLGNPYDSVAQDADGRVAIDFGVYGVPESYLIDRQGRIRYVWKQPFTPEEIKDRLLPMIAEISK